MIAARLPALNHSTKSCTVIGLTQPPKDGKVAAPGISNKSQLAPDKAT